ncbi:ABC transporter ATP-binding protein [Pseudolabrys sp.]|uniref:ABC transporter ATP-binding protein n=1 Tax=Pseudolabrys sp. TaxID=1960880 RepID=UPI003D121086
MSEPLLQVCGLNVAYGKVEAVSCVSFNVPAGAITTIIGANGAGKSTLLNGLMGILHAQGDIQFAGRSVTNVPIETRVRLGLSLVPERRELFSTMTVEDNLTLGAFTARHTAKGKLEDVYELFPKLRERRGQLAGTLSGGERQMLAMGRALMGNPKLLMLDEPSLGLAPLIVKEIFAIVLSLRARGVSILLIEQNARAALQVADRGIVLENGRIALEGSCDALAGDSRIVETYLGLSSQIGARSDEPVGPAVHAYPAE